MERRSRAEQSSEEKRPGGQECNGGEDRREQSREEKRPGG